MRNSLFLTVERTTSSKPRQHPGNIFLHGLFQQSYAILHCMRMSVCLSVAKCHREQTAEPRVTHSGARIGTLTKQIRLPKFILIINVRDLYFERQMFGYSIFLILLHNGLNFKEIFSGCTYTCRQGT